MKPLARWIIGPSKPLGLKTLKKSIYHFTKTYKDTFDYMICYNRLDEKSIEIIKSFGIEMYKQEENLLNFPPVDYSWKFYPPRLRIESHELIISNEVIITKKMPHLEIFLSEDKVIFLESNKKFGCYEQDIPKGTLLNSCFFGIPPGFDLKKEIEGWLIKKSGWQFPHDENGILAVILTNHPSIIVSNKEITSIEANQKTKLGNYGAYLNEANDKDYHLAWNKLVLL